MTLHYTKVSYKGYLQKVTYKRLLTKGFLQKVTYRRICVIDQACSFKMAGYWPSSFLRFYGPRRSRGLQKRKKENKASIQPS